MAAALDRFMSLDETIIAIKREHEHSIQAMKDLLLAAQIEAEMCRSQLDRALRERDQYMRVATQLIAQFATVEKVFSDAKAMALQHQDNEDRAKREIEEAKDPPPEFISKPRPASTRALGPINW